MNIRKHIGERIRDLRIKKGYTLTEFSYITDIEYCHLSNIELGKVNASLLKIIKICNVLDVCIVYLLVKSDVNFLNN